MLGRIWRKGDSPTLLVTYSAEKKPINLEVICKDMP